MAEIRLKDTVPHHPKFLRAGAAACWLYTCGIGYCQRMHTDGFIPRETLPTLGVDAGENPIALVARLVESRLWDECDGGWRIHDYLHENKSARQIRQLSRKRQVAGRRGGEVNAARFGRQTGKQGGSNLVASCQPSAKPRSAEPRRDRDRDRIRTPKVVPPIDQQATSLQRTAAKPQRARAGLSLAVPSRDGHRRQIAEDPDPNGHVAVITALVTKEILPLRKLDDEQFDLTVKRCEELGIAHNHQTVRKAIDSALFRYYRASRLEADLPPDPRGIYHDHIRPRRKAQ